MANAKDHTPTAPDGAKTRRRIDWEAIERDYRTGKFSLRELETKHRAGYADISKRAKKDGWTKDLRDAVKAATSAALIQQITTTATTEAQQNTTDVVLAAAELNKQVILGHRRDLATANHLAMELFAEVQLVTHSKEELSSLLRMACDGLPPDDTLSVRQAFNDLVKLHSRVSSVHKLADTLTKLQTLQRRAFGLDEEGAGGKEKPDPIDWDAISPADRQAAFMRLIGA